MVPQTHPMRPVPAYRRRRGARSRDGKTALLMTLPIRALEASLYGRAGSLLASASRRLSRLSSQALLVEKFRSGFSRERAIGHRLSSPVKGQVSQLCPVPYINQKDHRLKRPLLQDASEHQSQIARVSLSAQPHCDPFWLISFPKAQRHRVQNLTVNFVQRLDVFHVARCFDQSADHTKHFLLCSYVSSSAVAATHNQFL